MTHPADFVYLPDPTIFRTHVDFNAIYWLKKSSIATNSHCPLQSTPNGSCLFNSISILLTGRETLAAELRVRALAQLCQHMDSYRTLPFTVAEKHSPSIDDEIKTIKNIAGFAGHWSIVALSDILSAPIDVLYPSGGKINAYSLSLTRLYEPKLSKTLRPALKIMWTPMTIPFEMDILGLKHFCPLVSIEKKHLFNNGIGIFFTQLAALKSETSYKDMEKFNQIAINRQINLKKQITNIIESGNRKTMLVIENDRNGNMKFKEDFFLLIVPFRSRTFLLWFHHVRIGS